LYDLFRSAGLDVHRVFVPLPDERRVRSITPRDDRTALANAVRRPSVRRREIIEQRIKGWLTAALPNAVAVLAGRGDHAAFLDRLRDHLQRESGLEDMRVSGYRINSEMGMSTLFLEADDGPAYILKLPTHDRAEEELRGEVSLLSSIHAQDHQLSQLSGLVPTVVTSGLFDGQFFAV